MALLGTDPVCDRVLDIPTFVDPADTATDTALGEIVYNALFPCNIAAGTGMTAGNKSTRSKGRRRRRQKQQQQHRVQHGGVIGPHMSAWVSHAASIIYADQPSRILPFYQLIVFADIAKMLQKDLVQLDPVYCERIARSICKHLTNENILGAYLTSVFSSSLPNTNLTAAITSLAAGVAIYVAGSCLPAYGAAYSLAQTFSAANLPTYIQTVITLLGTLWTWTGGVLVTAHTPTHFFGIVNFGVLVNKNFDRYYKQLYSVPTVDGTGRSLPIRLGIGAMNLALGFVTWPGIKNQIADSATLCMKTYKLLIRMPAAVKTCISAARRYKGLPTFAAARDAASIDCSHLSGAFLDKISSDPKFNSHDTEVFLDKFEVILGEIDHGFIVARIQALHDQITTPEEEELADIVQIASPLEWDRDRRGAWVAAKKDAEDRMVARMKLRAEEAEKKRKEEQEKRDAARAKDMEKRRGDSSYSRGDGRSDGSGRDSRPDRYDDRNGRPDDRSGRPDDRSGRDSRPDRNSGYDRSGSRYDDRRRDDRPGGYGRGGGSSKHKKKHPRSTNKRKLLVKRVRRRRTTMKNKKR